MDAGTAQPDPPDLGYSGGAIAGAVVGTLLFPFISLIVALVLQGGQTDLRKREQLRTWAWASGGWLLFGVVVSVTLALVSF